MDFFSSGNYSFRRVIFVVQTHFPLMPALERVRKISVVSFVFVEVYALYDIIKWIHDIMHGQKYIFGERPFFLQVSCMLNMCAKGVRLTERTKEKA